MRFALIGNGFIGSRHIQAIERIGGKLVWVCDIDESKKVEGLNFTKDYREIPIKDIDYAIICTPNHLHFEMAQYFRGDEVEVLCEKPPIIDSEDFNGSFYDFNVVLQLHYAKKVMELKKTMNDKPKLIEMDVRVYRDKSYWEGWKGKENKSGGILFNIGVHYIDLLIYLFGKNFKVLKKSYSKNEASGIIEFGNSIAKYHFEIMDTNKGQTRSLKINGDEIELSNKDNLSYEDLHLDVYKAMLEGNCNQFSQTFTLIKLIEDLKNV